MTEQVKLGFEMEGRTIRIDSILPSKVITNVTRSTKSEAILASIREVGIIEPPVVFPIDRRVGACDGGKYLLLDGHTRIEALKEIGESEVFCLIATDDEAYTYNSKVNRLPPIQEHFMILKAAERGVSDERIARALKVDVLYIRRKRDMLKDICDDAVALLKNTTISAETLRQLRRVKPPRQVEIAEMMNMVANYGTAYCRALVAASSKDMITDYGRSRSKVALSPNELARLQREMETLQRDLQNHEETYGTNFLNLVIVRGYLAKLLDNGRVVRFLSANHPDMLSAFQQVVESTSLEG
jgi:hypothetical protein